MNINQWLNIGSSEKRNVYAVLLGIIVLTIPCYCLGIAALASAPPAQLPTPTPFGITPSSTPGPGDMPTLPPGQATLTDTPTPGVGTPTVTLEPTPTQLFPTVPASSTPTAVSPTATPSPTDTVPAQPPTHTPTGTVPATNTPTSTATVNATATAAANATATAAAANATATAAANATATAQAVNNAPQANDDSASTAAGSPITINVTTNDTDIDGNLNPATVRVVSGPANGTTSVDAAGQVTYTPKSGFAGTDTFTYQVCDTAGACDTATVSVTVTAINNAPQANDDKASTAAGSPITINVTANDTDIDGNLDPATVSVVSGPANGSSSVDAAGQVTYTPNAGFAGTDTFTYQVCDTAGACDTATVSVTVTAVNNAPQANDDSASTAAGTPITINVTANDTDIDGNLDPATVTVVSGPANGSTSVDAAGQVTYIPNVGFAGTDTFTYQVCDTAGACDTATVSVTVTAVNNAPQANDDSASTPGDTPVAINVTANDTDIDGNLDPATVSVVSGPANGAVSVDAAGQVTYTPNVGFIGSDTFTYQVCDTVGACDTATVTVVVG